MKAIRGAGAMLLAVLLSGAAAACGVDPTGVVDAGPAPAISGAPALARVYLVRHGRLWPTTVAVRSRRPNDVMRALFAARGRPGSELSTALAGLTLEQIQLVRYDSGSRNDPGSPVSLRMRLVIGGWKITRVALAQITCTARLRPEIWAVEIAYAAPGGSPKVHTCREFWDLTPRNGHLPP